MSSSIRLDELFVQVGTASLHSCRFMMFGRKPKDGSTHSIPWLMLLACSLGVVAPLLWHGPSCGHDFDFHLLSWIEVAHDWRVGLVDPQWLASANYGAGEPRFVFYPPASWMTGAILGSVGRVLFGAQHAWAFASDLFTFLCVLSAGLCAFLLCRTMASFRASSIAACLFVVNPYLLFVAYERTAYGELLATPLIALLLLCALRPQVTTVPLALVVAALWFINAPAAVMGCYTLAFVCLMRLVVERQWRNACRALAATVLGLGIAGCYLVPAVWQQRWVQIGRAVADGMRIEDSFLFRHTGQAYHDEVLHAASVIVVILFTIAALSMLLVFFQRRGGPTKALKLFALLLAMILFLQFPASHWLWHWAPRLVFLQFPWRWMLVASIVTAVFVACAIPRFENVRARSWGYVLVGVILIAGVSIWTCSRDFFQDCDEQDRVSGQLDAFQSGAGVEGTDEYTAAGADNSAIFQDLPAVRLLTSPDAEEPQEQAGDNPEWDSHLHDSASAAAGTVGVASWQPEEKQINVAASQPAFVVLKLMDYPAWNVSLNGRPVVGRLEREDGLMVVAVPAGSSRIRVQWKTTSDVLLGREVSAGALLILVVVWRRQERHAQLLMM